MPYAQEGTLTTNQKVIGVSGGWDTQTEWSNYQSQSSLDITNGVVTLNQISISPYTWDTDSVGAESPGPWTGVNPGTSGVSDAQAYSTPNSYVLGSDIGAANRYIETAFTADQYTDPFSFLMYQTADTKRAAVEYANGNGDTLMYVGTNATDIRVDAASTRTIDTGTTGQWKEIRSTFDWSAGDVLVEYGDPGFATATSSDTFTLKSVSPMNVGLVALTFGGTAGSWGGSGANTTYFDNVDISQQ